MRPASSRSLPTLENSSVTSFCVLVPPTKKPSKTLTSVFTSRPSGSQVGKGWRPASLARVALRRRSPLLTLLAQAGSASSGPTTSHRHAPTARTTASELLASTAPGRPEAAAVPPDATAARRGGPDLVCSQWESGGLQDLSSLAGQSEGRGLGRAGCWSGGECFRG